MTQQTTYNIDSTADTTHFVDADLTGDADDYEGEYITNVTRQAQSTVTDYNETTYTITLSDAIAGMSAGDKYYFYTSEQSVYRDGVGIRCYNTGSTHILNNTVYNCNVGMSVNMSTHPLVIVNNIFSDINNVDGITIAVQGSAEETWEMDYNIIYDADAGAKTYWDDTAYAVLSAFQSGTSKGANCYEVDPNFVTPGSDFRVQEGSYAIDKGTTDSAYSDYETTFGVSIEYDVNEVSRPQNETWDIGAHEQ